MTAHRDGQPDASGVARGQVFEPSSEVLSQELSGESVLLDLVSEKYFSMDAVGTRVWQLLSEGASLDSMLPILLQEFEVEPERLERDLHAFLGELTAAGLLRPRPGAEER